MRCCRVLLHILIALSAISAIGCSNESPGVLDEYTDEIRLQIGPNDNPVAKVKERIVTYIWKKKAVSIRVFNSEDVEMYSIRIVKSPKPNVEPQIRCYKPDSVSEEPVDSIDWRKELLPFLQQRK